ncbi:hypothetical protein HMPREF9248_1112 [Fannyhessea vaginae PB189-T1-4]|uniref:Uncharacterized protein n=1 Tax=Fannyhessea vaginae PB189-T1-4 TaxID=866774 RepID=A0ABP2J5K1_9ACTN|nr:hypothetical protein HMPREF9248_1112 [Fannyhessea vaginae PB189-T1-4]
MSPQNIVQAEEVRICFAGTVRLRLCRRACKRELRSGCINVQAVATAFIRANSLE